MNNKAVVGVLFVTGMFFLLRRKPKIDILQTNAQEKTVSYRMTYKDQTITDTFKLGDTAQFIPTGVDNYFFGAYSKGLDVVELAIGYFESNGGFKSVATRIVSF